MSDPVLLSVDKLLNLQIGTYLHVSSVALFVYDYLLTFADELLYIWGRPMGLGSVLFLLNRYLAFTDLSLSLYNETTYGLRVDRCKLIDNVVGVLFFFGIIISEIIMLLRVWVLWGRTRKITILLCLLAAAGLVSAAVSYTAGHGTLTFVSIGSLSDVIPGCYPVGGNELAFIDYALVMGVDTIILTMTSFKCFKHSRLRPWQLLHPSSLIDLFFRDGIMYFICLFAVSFANVVVIWDESKSDSSNNMLVSFQRCLHSVFVGRIFLHLRKEMERESNVTHTFTGSGVPGTLAFAHTAQSSRHTNSIWDPS